MTTHVIAVQVLPETGLRAPSRFSFKLNDVEHALDILVGFGRTVTHGSLGRKLVVRDAEQRLIDSRGQRDAHGSWCADA